MDSASIAFASKETAKNSGGLPTSAEDFAEQHAALAVQLKSIRTGNRDAVPLLNRLLQLRSGDPTGHAMLVLEYRKETAHTAPHFEKAGELLNSPIDALPCLRPPAS